MPPREEQRLLLVNGRIVTPTGTLDPGWVRIDAGVIAGVGSGATYEEPAPTNSSAEPEYVRIDLGGRWAGPGFVDIHVHGGGGHEIMDGDPAAVPALARFLAGRGVTSFLPTTYTADRADTLAGLEAIAYYAGPVDGGATVLGAHMEGPYLSRRRRGAHREQFLRGVDPDELAAFLDTGVVRLMAVAPEAHPGLVEALQERGVTVALGHTNATFTDMAAAAAAGASLVTHVFNGMRGMHHREPGAAGAALALDNLTCELIADGVHVAPAVMRVVLRAKGLRRVVLVSDGGKAAGMPDGRYVRAGRPMTVRDGIMRLPDGTISSSVSTLDAGFRSFCAANDLAFDAAWDVVSRNPLEAAGMVEHAGTLEVGKDADITVLDDDGQVVATMVAGRFVHEAW